MDDPRDLILELTLDAPRANIWRCWTEPALFTQWFTPKPWSTASADLDPRTGGRMNVTMRSPDGEDMPNTGIFLEVVPNERIVTTDAYSEGWLPSEKPFMTTIITLKDAGEGTTAYRAVARHWAEADKKSHEAMGFKDGWTAAARQLEALAKSL